MTSLRDDIKRAMADGFTNGYEQYDAATEAQRARYDMAADAILQLITTRLTSEEAVEAGAAALAGVSPSMVADVQRELWMREARTVIQAAIGRATHEQ